MRRSVPAVAIVAAFSLAGPADGQEPQPVVGNFGGGAVSAAPAGPAAAGSLAIGLRAGPGGRLTISATIGGSCASATFATTATVAPDGTFSASGSSRQDRVRVSYSVQGTLTATPAGTASAQLRVGSRRCDSGTVQWIARRPAGLDLPAATPAPATLFGMTSQSYGGARRGIVVSLSADGAVLSRVLYAITMRCTGGALSPLFDQPRDGLPLDSRGQASDREQGSRRSGRLLLRYDERFSATIVPGGARGTLSITVVARERRSGRRAGSCRTGPVSWNAVA